MELGLIRLYKSMCKFGYQEFSYLETVKGYDIIAAYSHNQEHHEDSLTVTISHASRENQDSHQYR